MISPLVQVSGEVLSGHTDSEVSDATSERRETEEDEPAAVEQASARHPLREYPGSRLVEPDGRGADVQRDRQPLLQGRRGVEGLRELRARGLPRGLEGDD